MERRNTMVGQQKLHDYSTQNGALKGFEFKWVFILHLVGNYNQVFTNSKNVNKIMDRNKFRRCLIA